MFKKLCMFAMVISLLILLWPVALSTGPTQPPVATDTLYVGREGWGPVWADPVNAYDTASRELIFNVYDTLISMGEPVTNDFGTWDVHEQYWKFSPSLATNVPDRVEVLKDFVNLSPFDPAAPEGTIVQTVPPTIDREYHICGWNNNNSTDLVVGPCDILYIMELDAISGEPITCRTWHVKSIEIAGPNVILHLHHFYYDFNIRTDPTVNFVDNTGAVVDTFDIGDAEYSFKRGLVQDQLGSPMWMFYKPLFDQMDSYYWDTGNPSDAYCLAYLIDDAFEIVSVDPPIFRINVGIDFPDAAFKQILCGTWASILSQSWCIGRGCWDGDLLSDANFDGYPDWWTQWRRIGVSPIQPVDPLNYAGTGPYRVVVTSDINNLVVLQRNALYWKGWPAPDRKSYLEYVDLEYISDWATRRNAFKACQLDVCDVPRAYMDELLDPEDPAKMTPIPPEIKTVKNIYPGLSLDAVMFTFNTASTSPYIGTGNLASGLGIPTNFFNYTDVRYAFSYAFNRSQYLAEAWKGEALCRETPLIWDLVPDYYTQAPDPPYKFNINYAEAKAHLQAAIMGIYGNETGTQDSVWNWGFTLTMTYNTGNDQRKIACNMVRDFFTNMSNDPSRAGKPPFQITVLEVDWPTYLSLFENCDLPVCVMRWQADYADADNFERPFMHSNGRFSWFQNYTADNGWTTLGSRTGLSKDALIDLAAKTPYCCGPDRAEMYADLDEIYLADCPSLPIVEPLGRRWQKYWVRGWYYNALYPSDYYYHLYKEDTPWADVTGSTTGVPDGVYNMLDFSYIAAHYGARAPDPTSAEPYDRRWAPGTYGCGGCDVYGDRKIDMRDLPGNVLTHDVAVTNVVPCKTLVGKGYWMSISVTVENQGNYDETFNVTVYADTTPIQKQTIALSSKQSALMTFAWDTTEFAKGSYTVKAVADTVTGEIGTEDNTKSDGAVIVGVPCDVAGLIPGEPDGRCDMRDIGYICGKFSTTPSSPDWDGNCDVTGPTPRLPDGIINMRDIGEACNNFMKEDP